jgi:hypothetical protein
MDGFVRIEKTSENADLDAGIYLSPDNRAFTRSLLHSSNVLFCSTGMDVYLSKIYGSYEKEINMHGDVEVNLFRLYIFFIYFVV